MMGNWGFGGGLFGLASDLVWLAVGILLVIWLWRQVKK